MNHKQKRELEDAIYDRLIKAIANPCLPSAEIESLIYAFFAISSIKCAIDPLESEHMHVFPTFKIAVIPDVT